MTIGPVQLLVLGFNHPDFRGEILAEFDHLKESDVVRIIDGIAVRKDKNGNVSVLKRSDLNKQEAAEFGAIVGGLIGLGAAGAEGAVAGAVLGAEEGADGIELLNEEDAWNVMDDIPNDSAAAVVLLEYRWAIPLRDAIRAAGGFGIADGFVHPEDLVAIGLIASEEAAALASPPPARPPSGSVHTP